MAITSQDTTHVHFPIKRHFTNENTHPYDEVSWELRTAKIVDKDGKIVFQQQDVEFPSFWSQTATNVVASKYFRGQQNTPERETSVKQMIDRIVLTISDWGWRDEYFQDTSERHVFELELTYIFLHQIAAMNSPVLFNIGVPGVQQQSAACFLIDVQDNLEDISEWYRKETLIFKSGSGSGINVSKIRGKNEGLSGGGQASGPLSFMKAADANAGVIHSGGRTRRAAKLVVMDIDHPDIEDFIWCKVYEEYKAGALIAAGYSDAIDGEAYKTVAYQNANHSVSVTNDFIYRVKNNNMWFTKYRTFECAVQQHDAKDLFHQIAQAAWEVADPGLFFYDTVNAWNTTPSRGPIISGNPCQEVMQQPDTSCNLGALNLLKFLNEDGSFDIKSFKHTIDVEITAQEILVSRSDYPTPTITKNSHDYRPLGLGFANLGALLMAKGLPYDSDEGRDYAASITALMTGEAYKRSAELAAIKGPFAGFEVNKQPMMAVIGKHILNIPIQDNFNSRVWCEANHTWEEAKGMGWTFGYRNSQVTLCQPTGTVALMMDCTTTGCEPDTALVSYKKLVGGGTIKHVNGVVTRALKSLGYDDDNIIYIKQHIEEHGSVEDMYDKQHLSADFMHSHDKPIFDCAFPTKPGGRSISWEGHIKMVAALQPFLSGSLSKTCNLPNNATVEDIERAYMMAWELGCKTISVYRDGCKQTQVLTTTDTEKKMEFKGILTQEECSSYNNGTAHVKWQSDKGYVVTPVFGSIPHYIETQTSNGVNGQSIKEIQAREIELLQAQIAAEPPQRKRLPDERPSITKKFAVGGVEGYFTVGMFEDGSPGELWVTMAKEGSTLSGFADAFATMVSLALQYGIPLDVMANKFRYSRFEPAGFTNDKDIPMATSIVDYILHWLQNRFTPKNMNVGGKLPQNEEGVIIPAIWNATENICPECGSILTRNGTCMMCQTCGFQSGCGA